MSAFICSPSHIGLLAAYAAKTDSVIGDWRGGNRFDSAQLVARMLTRANIRSVAARYPNDMDGQRPGPCLKDDDIMDASACYAAHYLENWPAPEPVQILKLCGCLDYQSCETNDWPETLAYRQLDYIRGEATRSLPGYENAQWCFDEHIEVIDSLFYDPA